MIARTVQLAGRVDNKVINILPAEPEKTLNISDPATWGTGGGKSL